MHEPTVPPVPHQEPPANPAPPDGQKVFSATTELPATESPASARIKIEKQTRNEQMQEAIRVARARVLYAAEKLQQPDCGDEKAFSLMWQLGHVHLIDLEEWRDGGAH